MAEIETITWHEAVEIAEQEGSTVEAVQTDIRLAAISKDLDLPDLKALDKIKSQQVKLAQQEEQTEGPHSSGCLRLGKRALR